MRRRDLRVVRGLVAVFLALAWGGAASEAATSQALDSAVLEEMSGSVWVLDPGQPLRPAAARQRVVGPSAVKTGDRSRAEMEFPEGSLVRLGSNAVFSFRRGTREMSLESGSLLLHVPKGLGGTTTVRTGAATAAITGTTVIISATAEGGFRMVVLEGTADVRYRDGVRVRCRAGDMSVRQPGQPPPRAPSQVHLGALFTSSRLTSGFVRKLPSLPLIQSAIRIQSTQLGAGTLSATGRTFDATTLDPSRVDGETLTPPLDPGKLQNRTLTTLPKTGSLQVNAPVIRDQPLVRSKPADLRTLPTNLRTLDNLPAIKR